MRPFGNFGTAALTCVPSPNDRWTVSMFPHEECMLGNSTWILLATASIVYLAVLALGFLYVMYKAWLWMTEHTVASSPEVGGAAYLKTIA